MAVENYSLVLNFNSAGQFASSVHHWKFDDSGYSTTQAAANALITAWLAGKKAALVAMLPTDVTLLSIRSRRIQSAGGFEAVQVVSSGNVGTRTGAQSASALCPCVIFYPVANSKLRGRWFLPGVSETDVVDGIFTAAYKTAISTNIPTILTNLTLAGGGTPSASMVVFTRASFTGNLIDQFQLSSLLGTQRRRQLPA
jgi:hypothetical protein